MCCVCKNSPEHYGELEVKELALKTSIARDARYRPLNPKMVLLSKTFLVQMP